MGCWHCVYSPHRGICCTPEVLLLSCFKVTIGLQPSKLLCYHYRPIILAFKWYCYSIPCSSYLPINKYQYMPVRIKFSIFSVSPFFPIPFRAHSFSFIDVFHVQDVCNTTFKYNNEMLLDLFCMPTAAPESILAPLRPTLYTRCHYNHLGFYWSRKRGKLIDKYQIQVIYNFIDNNMYTISAKKPFNTKKPRIILLPVAIKSAYFCYDQIAQRFAILYDLSISITLSPFGCENFRTTFLHISQKRNKQDNYYSPIMLLALRQEQLQHLAAVRKHDRLV